MPQAREKSEKREETEEYPNFGTIGLLLKFPYFVQQNKAKCNSPIFGWSGILMFLWIRSPYKMSEPIYPHVSFHRVHSHHSHLCQTQSPQTVTFHPVYSHQPFLPTQSPENVSFHPINSALLIHARQSHHRMFLFTHHIPMFLFTKYILITH